MTAFSLRQSMFIDRGGREPNASRQKLLLHCDGPVGSTGFRDASYSARGLATVNGDVAVSDTQVKFRQCAAFDGTGDYLTYPDHADWDFGTEDFFIQLFIYQSSAATKFLVAKRASNAGIAPFILYVDNSPAVHFSCSTNGSSYNVSIDVSTGIAGAWRHIAAGRASGVFRLWNGGAVIGTPVSNASALMTNSVALSIGAHANGDLAFNGYMDEIRIDKGAGCCPTGAFTPPPGPLTGARLSWN